MTTTPPATERVGRYQLLEPIGIGPSGTVSRAKVFGVAGFERQFAVKRFHAELTATAAMAAMLSAAARAYGSLEHPRIARMSEFGVAQGATFTAVEYVVGLDALRLVSEAKLAGATLAAGGALALVSQAARAVGYAHGRGLTHLGLAPTNVIVTGDGDIKITDFGILSATLPPRPVDAARLAQRIPYLAPEQLANEATSAATDVFALGVLAYELVTSSRAFKGDTPAAVAAAIMAGPPAEPPLPRPIARVLQRCLARSPFERFPDARAMADALDAALRVAPVPGTRKDIGAQVKETLDRLAALNEGQMSGMVALHLGTGPIRTLTDDDLQRAAAAAPQPASPSGPAKTSTSGPTQAKPGSGPTTVSTIGSTTLSGSGPTQARTPGSGANKLPGSAAATFVAQVPPRVPAPGPTTNPAPPTSPATTLPDLPRQPVTVPGLAPPPIPVPPGVALPSTTPLSGPPGNSTLLGLGKSPPAIPSIRPRSATATGAKPPAIPSITGRAPTRPGDPIAIGPAGPQAQKSLAQDASILEPEDLELDSPIPDSLELDAIDDVEPVAPQRTAPVAIDPATRATTVDTRAETGDPATRAATVDQGHEPEPESDPSSRPTRDLNARVTEPEPEPGASVSQIAMVTEGADALDDDEAHAAAPSLARTDTRPDPQLGRTMLGVAAPTPSGGTRRLAPPDKPSEHPTDERIAPTGDEIAAMALEGFHTADRAGDGLDPPTLRDPSVPSHAAPEPSAPSAPSQPAPPPTPPAPSQPIPKAAMPPGWVSAPISNPALSLPPPEPPAPSRGRGVVLGLIGLAVLGVGGWQLYTRVIAPPSSAPVAEKPKPGPVPAIAPSATADARLATADAKLATAPIDAATDAKAAPADARPGPVDAAPADARPGPVDAAIADAKAGPVDAAVPDAKPAPDARLAIDAGIPDAAPTVAVGTPAPKPPVPTAPANASPATSLAIASTPPGAHIFLDGADAGATPAKLAGSPDRHNLALVLPGHELYLAQVDGHGTFQVPLKEVTPTNGPAGIKVLRCKDKNRYYVFVDGKPTGQTCPTERIGCEVGAHTVEVYDAVTETRHKWDIVVKDTRLSFRVRVE